MPCRSGARPRRRGRLTQRLVQGVQVHEGRRAHHRPGHTDNGEGEPWPPARRYLDVQDIARPHAQRVREGTPQDDPVRSQGDGAQLGVEGEVQTRHRAYDRRQRLPAPPAGPGRQRGLDRRDLLLRDEELRGVSERRFKDWHRYRSRDLEELDAEWARRGAEFLSGTEKDIYNLPADWRPPAPLRVLGDPERFAKMSAAGDGVWVRPGPWYVVEYAASALGWDVREALYEKLMKTGLH